MQITCKSHANILKISSISCQYFNKSPIKSNMHLCTTLVFFLILLQTHKNPSEFSKKRQKNKISRKRLFLFCMFVLPTLSMNTLIHGYTMVSAQVGGPECYQTKRHRAYYIIIWVSKNMKISDSIISPLSLKHLIGFCLAKILYSWLLYWDDLSMWHTL